VIPARRTGAVALAVFILALSVHLLAAWDDRDNPFRTTPVSDASSYDQWARRLAAEGPGAEPVFHQAPLYPLFLGLVYGLADESPTSSILLVQLLQAILSAAAIALLVPLGRIYFDSPAAGVCAAAVALFHGPLALHSLKLLPVTLAVATQTLALAATAVATIRPRPLTAATAGIAWGAAFLTRSETLLFVPIWLAGVVWVRRREQSVVAAWRLVVVAALAASAVVAPATIHNAVRGDLVLIASSAGENLFIGNQRGGDGGHTSLDPRAGDLFSQRELAAQLARDASGADNPSAVSKYWSKRALAEVRADPAGWLGLEARKARRLLLDSDPADMYSIHLERRHYLPSLFGVPLPSTAIWLLGATGLWIACRRRHSAAWPAAALILSSTLTLMVFFVSTRLRLPLLFALTPFAGLAVAQGLEGWRAGRRRALPVCAAVVVVSLTALDLATVRPRDRETLRLASVLSMQNRTDESLDVLRPLIERDRPDPLALDQAGWVHHKRGEHTQATELYRRALETAPEPGRMAQIYSRLGVAEGARGRWDAAADAHNAAVQVAPGSAGARFERAKFRMQRGDRTGCVEDLRAAARLEPGWDEPRRVLGNLGEVVD
jgi:tetratricopeptide (TPR) repeat protein